MEVKLYNKLNINMPESFTLIGTEEKARYFNTAEVDYAFVMKEKESVVGVLCTDREVKNEKVAQRIAELQKFYSRMTPGFVMGEMRISDKIGQNLAVMSYKSNAPTRDLYNILALTTMDEKELLIIFSCDLKDSINLMPGFLKILDSIYFN